MIRVARARSCWWPGLVIACAGGSPAPTDAESAAIRDSAATMFEAIPARLAADGPEGWLAVFEDSPTFLMASDGAIAFPSADSAAAFLAVFGPTVAAMDLEWRDVHITPLGPGLAAVAAGYDERIIQASGDTLRFGGYVTGVARSRDGTWRLQHLHWSSPRNDGP